MTGHINKQWHLDHDAADPKAWVFHSVDTPLYNRQCALLDEEITEILEKDNTKWGKMLWQMYDGVGHDHYGSFKIYFDYESVSKYKDDTLKRLVDYLMENVVWQTDVNEKLNEIKMSEETNYFDWSSWEPVRHLIDCHLELGYEPDYDGYIEAAPHLEKRIRQEYMLNTLKEA